MLEPMESQRRESGRDPSGAVVPVGWLDPSELESPERHDDWSLSPAGPAGPAAPPSIVQMLLQRKWLILGVFALVASVAIPPIWILSKPTYRSTAKIRVSPVLSRLVFRVEDPGGGGLYRSYKRSQVATILSPAVLQRVLDHPRRQTRRHPAIRQNRPPLVPARHPLFCAVRLRRDLTRPAAAVPRNYLQATPELAIHRYLRDPAKRAAQQR